MSRKHHFKQVDVFSAVPFKGNPLAVILEGDGLSDALMLKIARWTNLSETTFVLPPTDPQADYQVKIYTLTGELPFAGHPTLGTAHALLENGIELKQSGKIVQQCGVGNVAIAIAQDGLLAFKAPEVVIKPLPVSDFTLLIAAACGDISTCSKNPAVVDMGIRWLMVEVSSADTCLNLQLNTSALADLLDSSGVIGVAFFGRHAPGTDIDFEMRAFIIDHGSLIEDPVTGSANACLARLLMDRSIDGNLAPVKNYKVRQGTCRQLDGRISVNYLQSEPWIGGYTTTIIEGHITL